MISQHPLFLVLIKNVEIEVLHQAGFLILIKNRQGRQQPVICIHGTAVPP
jgi:hypothetical protein